MSGRGKADWTLKRKRRHRRWWVKWLANRDTRGLYARMLRSIEDGEQGPVKRYLHGMTPVIFLALLQRITPRIQKMDTQMRKAIPAGLRLCFTLKYLFGGQSYSSLSFCFRVSLSAVVKIIPEVSAALVQYHVDTYRRAPRTLQLPNPSGNLEQWLDSIVARILCWQVQLG